VASAEAYLQAKVHLDPCSRLATETWPKIGRQ